MLWIHSSREGTLIAFKNVIPLDDISSKHRCGWIVWPKLTVGPSSGFTRQYSRAGAHCKTSRHSLMVRSYNIAHVILSQPTSINVGGKLKSVNCVGKGLDFMTNFAVGGLPPSIPSLRKRSWLGCMEPQKHSGMLAHTLRWRFFHQLECRLMTSITISRAAHRPYYGDGRQFYTCKKLLVMKNGTAFLTVNCQWDGTGQKWVQMAIYGRLPSVALLFLKHSTKSLF